MDSLVSLMTDAKRTRTGFILGFLAFASWGLLSPLGKRLLDDFEPLGLNAVRFLLATIVILPFLGPAGIRESLRTLARREVLWFNLLANVSLTLFLYSLTRLEPTYATLGFYSAPLWTAALAHFSLGERMGRWFGPAVVGLFAGGYLALFGFAAPGDGFETFGMGLALASAVVWAFYTVSLRRHAPGIALRPLMGASFIFGLLYYYPLALVFEGPPALLHQSTATWGWMALNVLFPTLAAFILFNAALQRAPAGAVNILVAAELGFTALFAWLLFDDTFTAAQVGGLAFALVSVSVYLWVRQLMPQDMVSARPPQML